MGYEEIVQKNKGWKGDVPSGKLGEKSAEKLMRELRWANLGWVYQVSEWCSIPAINLAVPDALRSECTHDLIGVRSELIARQWSTKSYDFTPERPIAFPPILAELCTAVVRLIPWAGVFNATDGPASSLASPPSSETNESTQPDFSTWTEDYGAIPILLGFVCRHDADKHPVQHPTRASSTSTSSTIHSWPTLTEPSGSSGGLISCSRCKENTG